MPIVSVPGMRPVHMGELAVDIDRRGDVAYLKAREPLAAYPRSIVDCLDNWASERPDHVFLADRGPDGAWRTCTYAQARGRARAIAQ